ncbi:NAD(P)/FAD-dependent oxidoreductase [Kaistia granuli]|uniref:NAD(P)/FAD-dependent oxidoreductase n=1 Tax=Kaistia granuli TaxID=363259 RepID=UPI000371AD7A|nr:FAD-binding oxidoreductase [Kaistia granuli]
MSLDGTASSAISQSPYWWHARDRGQDQPLPAGAVDVAVIGSGYTGLCAALRLARAGTRVLVVEAGELGEGGSTRNGGMVSGTLKVSHPQLVKTYGKERADRIFFEAQNSVLFLEKLISENEIDCGYRRYGMYFAAYAPKHYDDLAREAEQLDALGVETRMVAKADQLQELNSGLYHGGRVTTFAGGLHPARYHAGLVRACREAGVRFVTRCRVEAMTKEAGQFVLTTAKGTVRAGRVVVATNAYTDGGLSWFKRRVIPIGSYIIATEELDPGRLQALIPGERMIQDTKRNLYYYRLSPDGRRMIFGGRTSFRPISVLESARRLRLSMAEVFPSLAGVGVTHSWTGNVAFTFDSLPHLGSHEGVHYALGCCGQGVALMSHFGNCLAGDILGAGEESAFAFNPIKTVPGYTGNPWFIPVIGEYYRFLDWLDRPSRS